MKANHRELVERLIGQIQGLYEEISLLSKSKPDNPINTFKLKLINEKLAEANNVLTGEFKPLKGFTLFDETSLPTNSDVVMVLLQYQKGLKTWRMTNPHSPLRREF